MRLQSALFRKGEEGLYEQAAREIQSGHRREGLWAKAQIRAKGDPYRSESEYLKLLVRAIADDTVLAEKMRKEQERVSEGRRIQEQQQRELQELRETLHYHSSVRWKLTLMLSPVFLISWVVATIVFYFRTDGDLVAALAFGFPFAAIGFLLPYGLIKAIVVRNDPLPAGERGVIWYWLWLFLFGVYAFLVLHT